MKRTYEDISDDLHNSKSRKVHLVETSATNSFNLVTPPFEEHMEVQEQFQSQLMLNQTALKCSFQPIPGYCYYLYEKNFDDRYFSMISPEEWPNCPHKFIGSYVYDTDGIFRIPNT